jgi:hypothetical protein
MNGKEFSCIFLDIKFLKVNSSTFDRIVIENHPNRDFLSQFYPKVEELTYRDSFFFLCCYGFVATM